MLTALYRQRLAHTQDTCERTAIKLDTDRDPAGRDRGHSHGGRTERASGETGASRLQDAILLPEESNLASTARIEGPALETAAVSAFDQ